MTARRICEALVFQRSGDQHGMEDAHVLDLSMNAFAVADGVSRLDYTGDSKAESSKVRTVAQQFCDTYVASLRNRKTPAEALAGFPANVSSTIAQINAKFGISYNRGHRTATPYATVGVAAAVGSGVLECGYIGDCGLVVIRRGGRFDVVTEDQLAPMRLALARQQFASTERRERFVQEVCRNNPDAIGEGGVPCGYGVFNGEAKANGFWRITRTRIEPGDIIVGYSDGGEPLVHDGTIHASLAACRTKSGLIDTDVIADQLGALHGEMRQKGRLSDDVTIVIVWL